MKRVGIVYLITEQPEARGVLDAVTETRRKTYCEEKSLSMNETYQARASGHAPTIRLKLPQNFEYKGETLCEYKGERYAILRDYTDEKVYGAELTLERVRGNAAPADTAETGESAETEPGDAGSGNDPEGDSDPNESSETSGANANSGADATIEDAEQGGDDP